MNILGELRYSLCSVSNILPLRNLGEKEIIEDKKEIKY
jgi:hypothetical protein